MTVDWEMEEVGRSRPKQTCHAKLPLGGLLMDRISGTRYRCSGTTWCLDFLTYPRPARYRRNRAYSLNVWISLHYCVSCLHKNYGIFFLACLELLIFVICSWLLRVHKASSGRAVADGARSGTRWSKNNSDGCVVRGSRLFRPRYTGQFSGSQSHRCTHDRSHDMLHRWNSLLLPSGGHTRTICWWLIVDSTNHRPEIRRHSDIALVTNSQFDVTDVSEL